MYWRCVPLDAHSSCFFRRRYKPRAWPLYPFRSILLPIALPHIICISERTQYVSRANHDNIEARNWDQFSTTFSISLSYRDNLYWFKVHRNGPGWHTKLGVTENRRDSIHGDKRCTVFNARPAKAYADLVEHANVVRSSPRAQPITGQNRHSASIACRRLRPTKTLDGHEV
jgi:hypothetical protein